MLNGFALMARKPGETEYGTRQRFRLEEGRTPVEKRIAATRAHVDQAKLQWSAAEPLTEFVIVPHGECAR